jgi:hypothetical protein
MSRSGYSDDLDQWQLIRWRGAVKSALRGRRGQAFLRELLAALDAIPDKALVANELKDEHGGVCALGAVCAKRGIDTAGVDPDERDRVAKLLGIPEALVAEIVYHNDEYIWPKNDGKDDYRRFDIVRKWVVEHITETVVQ